MPIASTRNSENTTLYNPTIVVEPVNNHYLYFYEK